MTYQVQSVRPIPLLQDRGKSHSQIWDCHWTWERGSKLLVLAPSGKGKSTLVHALYGLRKDYEGQITFDQKPLSSFAPDEWSAMRSQKLSVVFQDLRLFPELTAMENCQIKALLQAGSMEDTILQMATALGVHEILEQTAGTLSYGQQQRIAIIRALLQPFEWLLLDEPFSHLDEANTAKAAALIQTICRERQAGMLMVSLGEAYGMSWDQTRQL